MLNYSYYVIFPQPTKGRRVNLRQALPRNYARLGKPNQHVRLSISRNRILVSWNRNWCVSWWKEIFWTLSNTTKSQQVSRTKNNPAAIKRSKRNGRQTHTDKKRMRLEYESKLPWVKKLNLVRDKLMQNDKETTTTPGWNFASNTGMGMRQNLEAAASSEDGTSSRRDNGGGRAKQQLRKQLENLLSASRQETSRIAREATTNDINC